MSSLLIRRYQDTDHDAVVTLHKLALKEFSAYVKDDRQAHRWEKDFEDIAGNYLNNHGEFLVGYLGNKLVTMGSLRKVNNELGELKRMRVHPDYQRQGLGQTILLRLEERAKKLGYKAIQLDTTIKQIAAQKLYEKNGYKVIRIEKDAWPIETYIYQKKFY